MPVLIWKLRNALVPRSKMLDLQQRPRSTGGRAVAAKPTMPWLRILPRPLPAHALKSAPVADSFPVISPLACGSTALIWPLKDVLAQARLKILQRRPCSTGGQPKPKVIPPLNLAKGASKFPSVIHMMSVFTPTSFKISGVTKDSTGAVLGNCVVKMYRTTDNVIIDSVTSDTNGLFEFRSAAAPPTAYYLVAYKAGGTDVAGTTVNTIVGIG